ncbi:MAG: MBL fold metallo-hydrolase [Actinobacteria bacterium]|nr:MBL fold metallo-hydrolase [Actinomycetota bacterium]
MHVTFFGVRGSTPCHGDDTARYGGNTSCVALRAPGENPLFFDLGTGARYLGAALASDGAFRGTCLLSHLHWDHTQGLPFFSPLLCEGSELDVYAPTQDDGRTVQQVMAAVIRPPLFPVTVDELPGSVRFHDTGDCEFSVGGLRIIARLVPHIGPTLGYRVEWGGRSVAYLSDHQQPYDGSFSVSDGARELVEGVDLLIHDSQYTAGEFAAKSTWGHCTIDYAMWLAHKCGVGRLALFHHDPARTDVALDEVARCAIAAGEVRGFDVFAAHEGLTVAV